MMINDKQHKSFTREDLECIRQVVNQLGRWRFLNVAFVEEKYVIVHHFRKGMKMEIIAALISKKRIDRFNDVVNR